MIWICRLLCPKGHIMAAGATEADDEDGEIIAQSFVRFLHDTMPVVACQEGCYRTDLRTEKPVLDVHVTATGYPTLKDAATLLAREIAEFRMQEHLHQRRN